MGQRVFGDAGLDSSPLGRALRALEVCAERGECGVRELARTLDVSPSTAANLLAGLERLHLLQRTSTRRYRLGWRAASLGTILSEGFRPAAIAEDVLEGLAERTGETAHFATLEGTEVVYLAKVEGSHAVRLESRIGMHVPAHATACGKALLAFNEAAMEAVLRGRPKALTPHTIVRASELRSHLATVRADRIAVDLEEVQLHGACVGAPVLAPGEEPPRYAFSVSGPRERIVEELSALSSAVSDAAADLAARLYGHDDARQEAA